VHEELVPAPKTPAPEAPADTEAARRRALARSEELWSELSDCLRLAKQPTLIPRPDGTTLEVPLDLKTRSAVIRTGATIVDLDARLAGVYEIPTGPRLGEVVFANVILLPKNPDIENADACGPVVDSSESESSVEGKLPARYRRLGPAVDAVDAQPEPEVIDKKPEPEPRSLMDILGPPKK
jgi:hypothetical protein